MKSKDRKGVAARVGSWVQSFWLQPDGSTCQVYVVIAVVTLVMTASFAMTRASTDAFGTNFVLIVETLVLGLWIASLVKGILWRDEKLLGVRNVLLDMAFQKCRCNPNAIIIEAPMEPELVGKPAGKGYCHVCQARAVLKEDYSEAIVHRIHELLGERPLPDGDWLVNPLRDDSDPASYVPMICKPGFGMDRIPEDLPDELAWAREWLEAHPAKPQ